MKINEWTLGLAAVGVVSLASVAQADEAKLVPLNTALSSTTISGYVDTSAMWNPGTGGNVNVAPYAFNAGKHDGFNLNLVDIKISKPIDEGKFSAGYTADLMYGPDSAIINPSGGSSAAIREAHVDLSVPVGNGLVFQVGRFGNLLGYESTTSYSNPNYTRSYAWTLEPTLHDGILATYKVNDVVTGQIGVANTVTTGAINSQNTSGRFGSVIDSQKAVVSLLTLTAPESFGSMKGSAFYAGVDYGAGASGTAKADGKEKTHLYLGTTINTPIKELTFGAAYDSIWHMDIGGVDTGYASAIAGYSSYKITDKATFSVRGEYAHGDFLSALDGYTAAFPPKGKDFEGVFAATGTFDYSLWANVVTRLEARWDHATDGSSPFGGTFGAPNRKNELTLAMNVIYKF